MRRPGPDALSSPKRGGAAAEASSPKASFRRAAQYCTPHAKAPGTITISPSIVLFEPDPRHPIVQEFGPEDFRVYLEMRDVVDAGAVVMPGASGSGTFILQLRVRTLDGQRFCKHSDPPWSVVFQLREREEMQAAARSVLKHVQQGSPTRSMTSVPYASLDPAMALGDAEQPISPQGKPVIEVDCFELDAGELKDPVLTTSLMGALQHHLPMAAIVPGARWALRYSPKVHGSSLETMYRSLSSSFSEAARGVYAEMSCASERTLLVVQDSQGHVFGAYCPELWAPRDSCYGTGDAFVFRVEESGRPRVFTWTGSSDRLFMYSNHHYFALGSGRAGHAIFIKADMWHGSSHHTETYGNPCLAGSEEFTIKDLELWGLDEDT